MKTTFILLFASLTLQTIGQTLTVENTWQKGSTVIYQDVTNELKLSGESKSIKETTVSNGHVRLDGDKLVVVPAIPGQLKLFILTEAGRLEFDFIVQPLPSPLSLKLSLADTDAPKLTIAEILKTNGLKLQYPDNKANSFFSNVLVESYILTVAGTNYTVGNTGYSDNLTDKLKTLKAGDKISLKSVTLIHVLTGKTLSYNPDLTFQIAG